MTGRLTKALASVVVIAGSVTAASASSAGAAGAPIARVLTANASGKATQDNHLATHTDSGNYDSITQLGIGRYQLTSTFGTTVGCAGVTDYSGTARLVRNDGATLSGTVTGASQCIGFVEGLVEVDATFTLHLTAGTRDLVSAELTFTCSWPLSVTTTGGTGAERCDFSGTARFSTLFGYALMDAAGTVVQFGGSFLPFENGGDQFGATGLAIAPSRRGYWTVNAAGRVLAFGSAPSLGSAGPSSLVGGESVTGISASAGGTGYWLFTTRGRVLPFGTAPFLGDMHAVALNGPIVGAVATADGKGYLMVAGDGGVFTFGSARFFGSTGNLRLRRPVVGLAPTASGRGYWLAASDGGIFAFGDARFRGSMGATTLNSPVVGVTRYGAGYLMIASDGGIFNFGTLAFFGSLSAEVLPAPLVAIAAT